MLADFGGKLADFGGKFVGRWLILGGSPKQTVKTLGFVQINYWLILGGSWLILGGEVGDFGGKGG